MRWVDAQLIEEVDLIEEKLIEICLPERERVYCERRKREEEWEEVFVFDEEGF